MPTLPGASSGDLLRAMGIGGLGGLEGGGGIGGPGLGNYLAGAGMGAMPGGGGSTPLAAGGGAGQTAGNGRSASAGDDRKIVHGITYRSGGGAAPGGGLTLNDVIDFISSVAGGMASPLTGGPTDRARASLFGGIAIQRQQDDAYNAGFVAGIGLELALSLQNPCALGGLAGAGLARSTRRRPPVTA